MGLTDNHKMACGAFRSRAEKLGWVRGATGDGASIGYYYKIYPSASVTAFILIEFTYVGQGSVDNITLSNTVFMQTGSGSKDNDAYNEPQNAEDTRVIAFKVMRPVVYSETLTNLQTIIW